MEIIVKVVDVDVANEYGTGIYPKDGLYINSNSSNLIHVKDGSALYICNLPGYLHMINKETESKNIDQSNSINESTLLKTIAIMQKPELIKDI